MTGVSAWRTSPQNKRPTGFRNHVMVSCLVRENATRRSKLQRGLRCLVKAVFTQSTQFNILATAGVNEGYCKLEQQIFYFLRVVFQFRNGLQRIFSSNNLLNVLFAQ